jgi:hypothetical protein
MANVKVSLKGGKIAVDKNTVTVSISQRQTVVWDCQDGDFGIVMPAGIPDPNVQQEGNNNWQGQSGPFSSPGKVKYTVTASGLAPLDPEVDVVP